MKNSKYLRYIIFFAIAFLLFNMQKTLAETINVNPVQYMNKVVCFNGTDFSGSDFKNYQFPIPLGTIETRDGGRQGEANIYNLFYGMPLDGKAIIADKDYGIFYCAAAVNVSNFSWNEIIIGGGFDGKNNNRVVYSNPTAQIFFSKIGIAKAKNAIDNNSVYQYVIQAPLVNETWQKLSWVPTYADGRVLLKIQLKDIMDYINSHKEIWHYAEDECNKYCNKCTDNGYAYACNDHDLKDNYYALGIKHTLSDSTTSDFAFIGDVDFKYDTTYFKRTITSIKPSGETIFRNNLGLGAIVEAQDEKQTVLEGPHKCMNLLYSNSEIAGTRRYWFCEDKMNCVASCEGTCVTPKDFKSHFKLTYEIREGIEVPVNVSYSYTTKQNLTFYLQNYVDIQSKLDVSPYLCYGTKKKNVVFPNGESTEDAKYYTDDLSVINKMFAYKGDGIEASLGNIYKVGTGKITCEGVFGKDGKGQFAKVLREIFKYMRIIAVGLFVIFTTLDFIKAISASEDNPIKTATKNLTSRFIYLLILLVLPTLINIVLSIIEIKNGLCFLN